MRVCCYVSVAVISVGECSSLVQHITSTWRAVLFHPLRRTKRRSTTLPSTTRVTDGMTDLSCFTRYIQLLILHSNSYAHARTLHSLVLIMFIRHLWCLWSWHGWITATLFLLDCQHTNSIGFSLLSMQRLAWFTELLGMIMFRRC